MWISILTTQWESFPFSHPWRMSSMKVFDWVIFSSSMCTLAYYRRELLVLGDLVKRVAIVLSNIHIINVRTTIQTTYAYYSCNGSDVIQAHKSHWCYIIFKNLMLNSWRKKWPKSYMNQNANQDKFHQTWLWLSKENHVAYKYTLQHHFSLR